MRPARLLERRDLAPSLAVFRFDPEGGVPDFLAGQFVMLGAPLPDRGFVWRAYSIASPPEERRHLELYVRRVPGGRLTSYLFGLRPGEDVLCKPPRGAFTLRDRLPDGRPDRRRLVLVGGGTGVAPLMAMARHLDRVGTERAVCLCHGASYADELGYADELRELERRSAAGTAGIPAFRFLGTVSRPDDPRNHGWDGPTGRVERLLPDAVEAATAEPLEPARAFVHVCGYRGTVDGTLAALAPRGFRTARSPRADGSFDVLTESYG